MTATAAADKLVTYSAETAISLAANALPALKPNHPNHNNPASRITYGMLFGLNSCESKSFLFPTTSDAAKAAKLPVICTIVPPAKSIAPNVRNQRALRVTPEGEEKELDLSQNGEEACSP